MSTSTTHQQSLADTGSETRPLMLERGSCIPQASHFRRYLNRKRENRKWLNKAIVEGPYEFKDFTPSDFEPPRLQTEDDLTGDDLKHYEAEIEVMNLILIPIPNDIYNFVDACKTTQAMWQRVERLMRGTMQNKVDKETRFNNEFDQFVAEPGEALVSVYSRLAQLMNDLEQNGIKFPIVTVNTKFLNCLQPEWLKYVTQVRLAKRNTRHSFVLEEIIEGNNVHNDAGNIQRTLRTTSSGSAANVQCYNCSEKVTLTDEQNDFLVVDATRMEEIEELSANICLMAIIHPANIDSDARPSYDSAFLSEVQNPSTSFVNPLFANDNQEQPYPKQPKIINNTIGADQIDRYIIFDEPNVDVNSGSVEYDNNVQASYELEQLAKNASTEAEKQQINANIVKQQNKVLTQQLELYKEKVRVFEMTKGNHETFFNEFIGADRKAKRLKKDLQTQFTRDRDII
ncbi:hypothetical protein Tco_0400487 [Tanacetum coccineum]